MIWIIYSVKDEFSYLDRVNDHPEQGDGRANKTVALLNKCHHGGGWFGDHDEGGEW